MKKLGVAISLIMLIISIITISYASFVVDGESKLSTSVSNISINAANVTTQNVELFNINSEKSKGIRYFNNNGRYEVIKDEAKVEMVFTINQIYSNYDNIEICLNVNNNECLYNLKPTLTLNVGDRFAYFFDSTFSNNTYTFKIPVKFQNVYNNNYFNYIATNNGSFIGTFTEVSLVIDFSNAISSGLVLNNINDFTLTIEGMEEI